MDKEKFLRAFLAIDPPHHVLNEIAEIQKRFKREIQGDVRWVKPDGIHLTLKFFGAISNRDVLHISTVVKNHASRVKPFSLRIEKAGVFPDEKRPRVLWLGVNGEVNTLKKLQETIERGLEEIGFKRENRPFRPHLTLARIKEPRELLGLAKILKKSEEYCAGNFDVHGLILFKSDLTPQGAVYTKLDFFPLGEIRDQ